MKKVILDTNFLLLPGQFKVDIFTQIEQLMNEPYELCMLDGAMSELLELSKGNSKDSSAAKLGYVLAQQKGLKMLPSSGHVDDEIVDMVDEYTVVATQDQELKKRVKSKGAAIITMRQRHRLIFEG